MILRALIQIVSVAALLVVTLCLAGSLAAQVDPFDLPDAPPIATELEVLALDVAGGWLEMTHLGSELPPILVELGRRSLADGPHLFTPPLPGGPTMVCAGGTPWSVRCQEVFRGDGELLGPPSVEIELVRGFEVRGAYRRDLLPVAGAAVAVVPAELTAPRAFTVPLAVQERRAVRSIPTDEDGRFALPELAPGDYFLETVLPSGRVHRSQPFTVPERADYRRELLTLALAPAATAEPAPGLSAELAGLAREAEAELEIDYVVDLGVIEVETGLQVEVRAVDPDGEPVRRARVSARQGATALELLSFEGVTDAEGRAVLEGLTVEMAVEIECFAEGHRPWRQAWELLPVSIDCLLEPWARVRGELIGPDGQPAAGGQVALTRTDDGADPEAEPISIAVGSGGFRLDELGAGDWQLRAAAPGFQMAEHAFSLAPGDDLDLGAILLLAGRRIEGRVVAAENGEPLAGVEISAVEPPGAVTTMSDLDGHFHFAVGRRDPLVLRFETLDYAARELALDGRQLEGRDPLVVELSAAGFLLAVVEDADGRPCQGCRVVIRPDGQELWTDSRGEALSGPLAEGFYRVARPRITHLGSAIIEQGDAEVRHARVRSGQVTRVRLEAPRRQLEVRLRGELEGLWILGTRSGGRTERRYPDADGRYRVGWDGEADMDLYLHHHDAEVDAELTVWQTTVARRRDVESLELRLPGSLVHGRIVGAGGPRPGLEVTLRRAYDFELRARGATGADGGFRLPHVPPGAYQLSVGPRNLKFLTVRERQTVDLGTFEVYIEDDGAPPQGLQVVR